MARTSGSGGLASKIGTGTILTVLSGLILPIWLLALAGWAVQLAGLSAVQNQQSGHFLQFDWFVTGLMLIALLCMPVHLLARRSSPGVLAFLAVAIVLEILRTNVWNNARLSNRALLGANFVQVDSITNPGLLAGQKRVITLFSGYLITAAVGLLLLLTFGNLPASSAQDAEFVEKKGRQAADEHQGNDTGTGNGNHKVPAGDSYPSSRNGTGNSNGTSGQPGMVSWSPANGPPGGHVPVADRV